MPSRLGASGFVRARQMASRARLASEVHTFWPVSSQPPSIRTAFVAREARSEPAPGLGEHLAPAQLAPQRAGDPPLLLLGRTVRDERGDHPRADLQPRAHHTGTAELLVDGQLLDRAGVPAPRPWPVRREPAALHEALALLGRRRAGQRPGEGADLVTQTRRLAREVPVEVAADTGQRLGGDPCTPARRPAEELAHRGGTAQVPVGVVLPGEPDPAEDLDEVLGTGERCLGTEGAGDRGSEHVLGRVPDGTRGVPGGGTGLVDGDEHVRAAVLDSLELADRPAELLTDLGVAHRGVQTPGGEAGGFGGEQGHGELGQPGTRSARARRAGAARANPARRARPRTLGAPRRRLRRPPAAHLSRSGLPPICGPPRAAPCAPRSPRASRTILPRSLTHVLGNTC
jgi:hypothetical protein